MEMHWSVEDDSLHVQLHKTRTPFGYVGVGFPTTGLGMVAANSGVKTVICRPDKGAGKGVKIYGMTKKSNQGVKKLPSSLSVGILTGPPW